MKKRAVFESSILLTFSVFLAACGDMNTVIAKDAAYGIDVFVDTRNLDDGAAISFSDSIRPSFSSEIEDDPDVRGISISLETVSGSDAASEVIYRLSSDVSALNTEKNVIRVPRLTGELPAFDLPKDLAVGRYILVMRVLGEEDVLFERRRSIFYLADAKLVLNRIVSYPPGAGTSSRVPVFPMNIKLLLQADIEADGRLDPYVAWYVGTKRIGMGRLADGANRILWTTPSREGFQSVRVEVYPEPPTDLKAPDLIGASADITVATAITAPLPGLPGESTDYIHLYRLLGELTDSADIKAAFVRTNGGDAVWAPFDDSYGLSIGATEQYRLDLPLLPVDSGVVDACRIITRVAIFGPGAIWRASFVSSGGGEGLQVELASISGGLELRLISNNVEQTASIALPTDASEHEAVLVNVNFSVGVGGRSAAAQISVNEGPKSTEIKLPLSSTLLDSGSVRLGGIKYAVSKSAASETKSVETTSTAAVLRTAVIDEFAVTLDKKPVAENDAPTFEI